MTDYSKFLESRLQYGSDSGFAPVWMPDFLMDFQAHLVEWSIRKGRSAIFADCGLGKTAMEVAWAENVVRHTNRPVLIFAPLAVSRQIVREGEKFGIDCRKVMTGSEVGAAGIYVANYQRHHVFDSSAFSGVACDESSILKNSDGKTKAAITEFMRLVPHRLLGTATAAPNDYDELGTSSEALGELGYQDMLTRFFKKQMNGGHRGWSRAKHHLRGHAERDFWKWVTSWSRAIRRPSDLGFDDSRFVLPPLHVIHHTVQASRRQAGRLFDVPAQTLQEQQEETRRTIHDRCGMAAELANEGNDPVICWCHMNDEADELERSVRGAVQVSGSDSDEEKEEKLMAFVDGQARVLVTKPKIAGFGMNFQFCNRMTTFPTHSYESYYQLVRRCWRFGQTRPVSVHVIGTEGSAEVLANLQRKDDAASRMFDNLVALMNQSLRLRRSEYGSKREKLPSWLSAA